MRASLRSKIAIAMWALTALSTLTASVLTGFILIRSHRESVRNQLEASAASLIALGISDFSELEDFEQLNLFIEDTLGMEKADKIVRIYDPSGRLVFTTVGLDYDLLPDRLEREIEKPAFLTLEGRQRKYESLVVPYLGKGKKKPHYLQVVIPLPRYSQIFGTLWWQVLGLFVLMVGVSLVLSRRLSGRLLKPVAAIADHLQKMDPHKTEKWEPLGPRMETHQQGLYLKDIIGGIDSLTERTRRAVLQIRKMSRYVAHELRTPLTILQGEAETVLGRTGASEKDYARVLRSSLEEIQRMSDTVTTLLQLGEWERAASLSHPVRFDLATWILENKARWEKTLGREIRMDLSSSERSGRRLEVQTDPRLLYHLIDNLIRNVRDHTGVDCLLSVVQKPSPPKDSGDVEIHLSDAGPGLPPDLLKSLNHTDGFEVSGRFPEEEIGVGLSLCRQIVDICKLRLQFSNRPEGGLIVAIGFPDTSPWQRPGVT